MKMYILNFLAAAIGGAIPLCLKFWLDKKNAIFNKRFDIVEERYRYLVICMSIYLNPSKKKYYRLSQAVDLCTKSEYMEDIKIQYDSFLLYAPKCVLIAVKSFIDNPSVENKRKAMICLRNDLLNKKSKLLNRKF